MQFGGRISIVDKYLDLNRQVNSCQLLTNSIKEIEGKGKVSSILLEFDQSKIDSYLSILELSVKGLVNHSLIEDALQKVSLISECNQYITGLASSLRSRIGICPVCDTVLES